MGETILFVLAFILLFVPLIYGLADFIHQTKISIYSYNRRKEDEEET